MSTLSNSLYLTTMVKKNIDDAARRFIKSAYKIGVSVLLINKFLEESDYKCNTTQIHYILWNINIQPNGYNCSPETLIWRRYLTNIIETFDLETFEEFEAVALREAEDYYNIDRFTFIRYWYDFIEHHNRFMEEQENPPNIKWIRDALLYFGFNFTSLSQKIRAKDIPTDSKALYDRYMAEIQGTYFSSEEFQLRPKFRANEEIRDFWSACYGIGKDFITIIKWTEIFTGLGPVEDDLNFSI